MKVKNSQNKVRIKRKNQEKVNHLTTVITMKKKILIKKAFQLFLNRSQNRKKIVNLKSKFKVKKKKRKKMRTR
jgi:hypothetical protein